MTGEETSRQILI